MRVKLQERFNNELSDIVRFITKDSAANARRFAKALKTKIASLSNQPYKCRKSTSFNDEQMRDLIFKGYVIPYYIDEVNDCIFVFGIFKENEWETELTD